MKTSDVFNDREPPEEIDPENEELMKSFQFPWHCKMGVIENAKALNNEFNECRHLSPVKIFITGPPASGKTFYTDKTSAYYNLPRIHVKALTDQAFKMAAVEEEEADGLAAEIKAKIEELKDAAVEALQA